MLGQLAVVAWMMTPEHKRQLILMRAAELARRSLDAAARRAGRGCMGTELATGHREYTAPLTLSLTRDYMAGVYQRLRGN